MSLNVNDVYQQVLTIVNKNQVGGYIDSDEFNRYAKLAQLEWFNEAYLDFGATQNSFDNFAPLQKTSVIILNSDGQITIPSDYYHLSQGSAIKYTSQTTQKEVDIEVVSDSEYGLRNMSSAFRPNKEFPVSVIKNGYIQIYPKDLALSVTLNYLKLPEDPIWGYTVSNNEKVYDSSTSTDFLVPKQHEQDIVQLIVKSIGTEIRDPALIAYQPETNKPVQ